MTAASPARAEIAAGPEHLGRIPADRRVGLIGYRLACPACDWTTVALPRPLQIEEAAGRVTFGQPVTCAACGAHVSVTNVPIQEARGVRGCCRSRA